MHILMIDDVPAMAESFGRGLQARGWKVHYRETAGKALDEFARKDFPYDVAVLDLSMPVADVENRFRDESRRFLASLPQAERAQYCGKLLYQEFRQTHNRTEPLILLTNYAQDIRTSEITDHLFLVLDKGETSPGALFEHCFRLKREWERRLNAPSASATPGDS